MIILRLIAMAALIMALVAGVYDIVLSSHAGKAVITPLGKVWFDLDSGSLNLVQALVERYLGPGAWDPWISTVLQWPAWAVFAGLAIFLALITRIMRA